MRQSRPKANTIEKTLFPGTPCEGSESVDMEMVKPPPPFSDTYRFGPAKTYKLGVSNAYRFGPAKTYKLGVS